VIVTARDASIRSGPLDEAKTVFTAHDGAELAVLVAALFANQDLATDALEQVDWNAVFDRRGIPHAQPIEVEAVPSDGSEEEDTGLENDLEQE